MIAKGYKFYSDWCMPCKALGNILKDFTRCSIEEINVEENEELTTKYGIRNIPCIVFVDSEDREVFRHIGMTTLDKLNTEFDEYNK